MSEAAPRIYVYPEFTHSVTESCPTDVGYVREDIVDELVKALEGLMDAYSDRIKELSYQQGILVGDSRMAKARAVLAKLEDSHD